MAPEHKPYDGTDSERENERLRRRIETLEKELDTIRKKYSRDFFEYETYHLLVELASSAMIVFSLTGDILDCNTAACNIYGYTKEEMHSLNLRDLVDDKYAKELPRVIPQNRFTGKNVVHRINRKKDGSLFPIELNTQIVDIAGKKRLLAYIIDETMAEELERKRERLKKVELEASKLRTASKLAATVAHEVNTPLGVLQNVADLITMKQLSDEDLQKVLRLIPNQVEKMKHLVNRFLSFNDIQEREYVSGTTILDLKTEDSDTPSESDE